jgi:hypothetical protein
LKTTCVLSPARAARPTWERQFISTTITAILVQRAGLCRSALLSTGDVNEAYLAVHSVISHALSRASGPKRDLALDLLCALDERAGTLGVA